MREFTIGEHASRFHGSGFDFVGPARMAGGRSVRVHRLAAVVADQLQPAHHSRVRAAEHVERRDGRRSIAVDSMRDRRRADRGDHRARAGDDRDVGRVLPGFDRPGHVRSRVLEAAGPASAHRQGAGHSLPRCLPARRRPPGTAAHRRLCGIVWRASCARRRWCRSSPTSCSTTSMRSSASSRTSIRCTTCFSGSSTRRLPSSCPGVSAGWVEAFDVESGRSRVMSRRELSAMAGARARVAGRRSRGRRSRPGLDALRLESDPTKFDVALLEWVAERRLRRALGSNWCDRCDRCDGCTGAMAECVQACWVRWLLRLDWLLPSWSVLSLAQDAERQQNVEVDPVTCWWRPSVTSVRVGETFASC